MPDKLLVKSLKRPRKYYVILSILVIMSVFFFCTVSLFYDTMVDMKYGGNQYGFQHCTVYNTSKTKIDKLCAENGIEKTILFERTVIPLSEERNCFLDAVPDDYFSFTEYDLATGTFPKNSDEVCCETSFLFELGIPHSKFIGSKIELGGKAYTVTGTFIENRIWSTLGFNEVHCFTAEPKNINSVAFSATSIERCQSIMNIYERICNDCVYNMNLWAISINKQSIYSYYLPVMILMIAVMAAVFVHIIMMILMYQRKNIGIARLVGIPLKDVRKSLFICLMQTIVISALIGAAGSIASIGLIQKLYDYTYCTDVTEFTHKTGPKIIALRAALIILVFSLVSLAGVFLKTINTGLDSVKNSKALKLKHRETNEKITDSYIAKKHIKVSKLSNIITFVVILFLMCTVPSMKIYFRSKTINVDELEGYDYVADIDIDMVSEKTRLSAMEYMKTIAEPEIEDCTACPIYSAYCELPVSKELINKKYAELLSHDNSKQLTLYNDYAETVDVPFMIIGISDAEQEKMGLKLNDTEAIAYRKVIDLSGKRIYGLKDDYFTKIKIDDEYSLNVIDIEEQYFGCASPSTAATVMIVNPNTYKELFGEYEIPSRILYKVTEDAEDELTGLFSGRDYIELTDVKNRNGNNRQVKVIDKIYYLIAAMTFVFVVLNCIVIAYINVTNNKKEYAIMSALGISKSNITKMIAYQLCSVMIRSLVIADIISVIHTDMYLNSINSNSKVMYSMPYAEIIFCNIVILCSCAGVLFLFIRKFWNMVAKEKMRD